MSHRERVGGSGSLAAVATAALATLLLVGCGGGGGDSADEAPPRAQALSASRPGELLAYVKARLRARAELRQARPGLALSGGAPLPPLVVSAEASDAPVLRSATTVQEAGVDEDDLIKTDGALVYTLDTGTRSVDGTASLVAHRRLDDGGIEPSATLTLPAEPQSWPVTHGMLLAEGARRIAVLGEAVTLAGGTDPCDAVAGCLGGPAILPVPMIQSARVVVRLVDAAGDGSLALAKTLRLEGRLVGSRLIGDALVVVTSHAPQLAVEALPPDAPAAQREAALDALTVDAVLPTLRDGTSAATPLVAETDCYVQPANASAGIEITTISVIDLRNAAAAPTSRCIVGGTEAIYLSTQSLVLATTRLDYRSEQTGDAVTIYPAQISTDLHKFALAAEGPIYRGSGSVAGHLGWDSARKPYRISEHDGLLRVLTFTGETGWATAQDAARTPPSPATLTILREAGAGTAEGALEAIARLPNERRPEPLGKPGEQVHGVRFLGDRAYVVTFRQVDPLYVLDLADAADPKVAGVLEVPGFSDHLFPLAGGLLLGVGRDADPNGVLGGVKVALFDVRDLAAPRVTDSRTFGVRGSSTALDATPHGINWLMAGTTARIALPMLLWNEAGQPAHGLHRFEVDTAARTFAVRPTITAGAGDGGENLWQERSVQIGEHVYWLTASGLSAWRW
jgi:hypothetical protein